MKHKTVSKLTAYSDISPEKVCYNCQICPLSFLLFLLQRSNNLTYVGVPLANFSTLDKERRPFDKQSDSLTCDIEYQQR